MKKIILMTTMVLATLSLALTGCKEESIKLSQDKLSSSVGETQSVKLMQGDEAIDADWSISDEAIATIEDKGSYVAVTGVAEGECTLTASYNGETFDCAVTVEGAPAEDVPVIALPGDGMITIAIRVPAGTCNGVYAAGTDQGWDPANTDSIVFTQVDGTDSWYTLTLPAAADRMIKVIAKPETAAAGWDYQWGMNKDGEEPNVKFVEGYESDEITIDGTENGGEVKLTSFTNEEGNVVYYFDIVSWKSLPCAPVVPGGTKTFSFTLEGDTLDTLADLDSVAIAGNFAEAAWGASRIMTKQDNGTYEWTGEFPENFNFKPIIINDGAMFWYGGDNASTTLEDADPVERTFQF